MNHHKKIIEDEKEREKYFNSKVGDLLANIKDLKDKTGTDIMILMVKSDGEALSYSSELLQPLESHIQSQKLIENCIYKNHIENLYKDSPKDSLGDDLEEEIFEEKDPDLLNEVWTSFQKEVTYKLNEAEQDLWSDLKNEFGH